MKNLIASIVVGFLFVLMLPVVAVMIVISRYVEWRDER